MMTEAEYNRIEIEILKEMEELLSTDNNNSNIKAVQSLRQKLRKLRLENLDNSNIRDLDNPTYL